MGIQSMQRELPQCQSLPEDINNLLGLLAQEVAIRSQLDTTPIETSLKKVLAPKFEIVFAGAFSAGKSMLINALLGRELLYSAEGHATGTECYIAHPEPQQTERVVLTFLSIAEIQEQATAIAQRLGLQTEPNIGNPEVCSLLQQRCQQIIQTEGGESKSERAKQANALHLLLEGYHQNLDRLGASNNAVYSMEQFNFTNLKEAADYARRGKNSSVLKRIEYYCFHPLLEDGNVLIDMPGIDAPVKRDADLTYRKIEDENTSAVICVLKPASAGDMTTEETDLLERMRSNVGIRDRVFYVFNRIDETWYNSQLRQRLEDLIQKQFYTTQRLYKTSGLLGFYGTQILNTTGNDRFGLDSVFVDSVKGLDGQEEIPQFVNEFNRYCANSGKLAPNKFRVSVNSYETPNENYVRILAEQGKPLIEQLIQDSGVEDFRAAITHYLAEEKWPELFKNLAQDLEPLCIKLQEHYQQQQRHLESQPTEVEAMKAQELERLNHELQQVGQDLRAYIQEEVNTIVVNEDSEFETDFTKLKARMVSRLDELLRTFSVAKAYSRATLSHPRNATAPLLAVLVEALYDISNQLEDILVESSLEVTHRTFDRLLQRIVKTDFYRRLYRIVGSDAGITDRVAKLRDSFITAIVNEAKTECDRYVRESPRFYDEGTFSIYQFRQTLQQTSQGYDCESMLEAEPAIRQVLKLDFEPKVNTTIRRNFRQTFNQTIKTQLLPAADQLADNILQQYDRARSYLQQTLEQEAQETLAKNRQLAAGLQEKVDQFNQSVSRINHCLQSVQLFDQQLPCLLTYNETLEKVQEPAETIADVVIS
jgi:replication fork clamp-binding protein CrfC